MKSKRNIEATVSLMKDAVADPLETLDKDELKRFF